MIYVHVRGSSIGRRDALNPDIVNTEAIRARTRASSDLAKFINNFLIFSPGVIYVAPKGIYAPLF